MANKNSSLMSWMKGLFVKKTSDSDLKRWAQTEYGNDWQAAYQQMKTNPGKVPTLRGVYQ
jgi:hypothetical protein